MYPESERSLREENEFLFGLSKIIGRLEETGLDYRVVGGVALRATLGEPLQTRRENGSIPDLDVLVLSPVDRIKREKIRDDLLTMARGIGVCPRPNLEFARSVGEEFYPFLEIVSGLKFGKEGEIYLVYGSVEEEIPSETFAPVFLSYGGISFLSLPAKTLFYRYLVRACLLKPKDFAKLNRFMDWIRKNPEGQPADYLYKPYISFAVRVNQKYPGRVRLFSFYATVDNYLQGKLSSDERGVFGRVKNYLRG